MGGEREKRQTTNHGSNNVRNIKLPNIGEEFEHY